MNIKVKNILSILLIFILLGMMALVMNMVFPNVIDEQDEIVLISKVVFYKGGYTILNINSSYTDSWLVSSNTVRLYPIRNGTLIWLHWELLDHVLWKEWKISYWFTLGME